MPQGSTCGATFLSICSLPEFWAVSYAVTACTAGFTWLQTYYAYIFLHALLTLSISSYSEFPSAFTSKPKIPRTPEEQCASPRKGKIPAIAPQFSQSGPQQASRPSSSGSSTRSRQSKWKKSSFLFVSPWGGRGGSTVVALQEWSRMLQMCQEYMTLYLSSPGCTAM